MILSSAKDHLISNNQSAVATADKSSMYLTASDNYLCIWSSSLDYIFLSVKCIWEEYILWDVIINATCILYNEWLRRVYTMRCYYKCYMYIIQWMTEKSIYNEMLL